MLNNHSTDYAAVVAARERISAWTRTTPLVECEELNERLGGRLLVKLEPLQRSGSFKIRGALSALTALKPAERERGVVAYSSGNHGIAIATAARILGCPSVVVMPADAPKTKQHRTQAIGAEVVLYDRTTDDRETICRQIAESRGLTIVAPFDDPMVIAGQGTIALEIAEQAAQVGADLNALAVPCSGGGLAAGCTIALSKLSPQTRIVTAEPFEFDDMARSLEQGRHVMNKEATGSICDALLVRTPGKMTLPILRGAAATGVSVSDEEALAAMRMAMETFKIAVEPGGAVALAAAITGKVQVAGRVVAVICSGGNADPAMFRRALAGE